MTKIRLGYFDLETQQLINQQAEWKLRPCTKCNCIMQEAVGGIVIEGGEDNLHSIKMSVGVVKETFRQYDIVYREFSAKELVKHLHSLDLIVGYNIKRFDYIILQQYGGTMLPQCPTFDVFEEINELTGKMISLSNVVTRTFQTAITKLSGESVNKWWQGQENEIIEYCAADVELTRLVFNYACKNGLLRYWNADERSTSIIDTSHWAEKARDIVSQDYSHIRCPVK